MAHFNFASELKWSRKMRLLSVFYFSFEISLACWLLSRPNLRIVSKLTTDIVTYRYCTEASNQKSKYAYWKIFFYKKSTGCNKVYDVNQQARNNYQQQGVSNSDSICLSKIPSSHNNQFNTALANTAAVPIVKQ